MQPQRPIASPEERSKPGYPLADYAEICKFLKIHINIAKRHLTLFSFWCASKGLSSYKMHEIKIRPLYPQGSVEIFDCAHIAARTPSIYMWNC